MKQLAWIFFTFLLVNSVFSQAQKFHIIRGIRTYNDDRGRFLYTEGWEPCQWQGLVNVRNNRVTIYTDKDSLVYTILSHDGNIDNNGNIYIIMDCLDQLSIKCKIAVFTLDIVPRKLIRIEYGKETIVYEYKD